MREPYPHLLRCPGCDTYLPARELRECPDGYWRCERCQKETARVRQG